MVAVNSPAAAARFSPTGPFAPPECLTWHPSAHACARAARSPDQLRAGVPAALRKPLCPSRYAWTSTVGLGRCEVDEGLAEDEVADAEMEVDALAEAVLDAAEELSDAEADAMLICEVTEVEDVAEAVAEVLAVEAALCATELLDEIASVAEVAAEPDSEEIEVATEVAAADDALTEPDEVEAASGLAAGEEAT